VIKKITLDTNIIFQALYSSSGASYRIFKLIRSGEIQIAISVPVFEEYRDVLYRKKTLRETGRTKEDMEKVLDFIALVGLSTPIDFYWRPNLRDESDNMFVELALASGSEYLVTRNVRDFTINNELLFDSFTVITPSYFLELWRRTHGE
jgi:putative PIN family toxin of toxin-antitoxin system